MELKTSASKVANKIGQLATSGRNIFVSENRFSRKFDLNFKSFKIMGLIGVFVFIGVVFLLPNDVPVQFTEKTNREAKSASDGRSSANGNGQSRESARSLWSSPSMAAPRGGGSQVNYGTSMVLGAKTGNAKTQLRAGARLPLRILDKITVSQDAVPVLAELLLDSETESGLRLPAGSRLYGEASFQRGSDRATVRFTQLSLPSGQIRRISSLAIGQDGQPGVEGRVFSDGMKNTTGQILTTFVGGLAAGSMQTDIFGKSNGGVTNGLLAAVSTTAQGRAQAYGEKLKTEREWIELRPGTECDAVLTDSIRLQEGGDDNESQ